MDFEEMYEKLQPMVNAHIRKLHIYKNKEHFRQVANVAIWLAWRNYDSERGDFEPYASQTIRGALLEELTKTTKYEQHYISTEDEVLTGFLEQLEERETILYLEEVLEGVSEVERALIRAYYDEGRSHKEIAEAANISVAALQKRKMRLLLKLREMLQSKVY